MLFATFVTVTTLTLAWSCYARPYESIMALTPVALYWVVGGLFWLCDTFRWMQHCKLLDNNQGTNRASVSKVIGMVSIQQMMQTIVCVWLAVFSEDVSLLDWKQAVWRFCVGLILVDTYQYWMHRWMHQIRFMYKHVHSVHHEIMNPYALAALYNHPVEAILMDIGGTGAAIHLLGMCPVTQVVFVCLLTTKTVCDHSGYDLPWDRWISNTSAYHFRHHKLSGMRFNLQQPLFVFWDRWNNTEQNR